LQRFLKKYPDLISPESKPLLSDYDSIRDKLIMIFGKMLDDESYDRSYMHQLYQSQSQALDDTREYSQFYESNQTTREKSPELERPAFESLKILNYGFLKLQQVAPVYNLRNLDMGVWQSGEKNIIPNMFITNLKKIEHEDYLSYQLNRMKAIKHTSLKRQNFSLLNELCYEMMNAVDKTPWRRTALDFAEFSLTGEGRILGANLSWS
jgi:hypothetical protein